MATEMGEILVGAYLKLIAGCEFVDYGVRVPGGGLAALNELDVVGINFVSGTAYLCEVTTHLRGLNYGGNQETVRRIMRKHANQRNYAESHLGQFTPAFSLWSPYVATGYVTDRLDEINSLDKIINSEYRRRINEFEEWARKEQQDTGNPAFRLLQILGALRD